MTLGWRGRGFQGQKSPVPGGLPAHSPSPIHGPKLKSSAWRDHWVQPSLPSLLLPSPNTQHSANCTATETKQPLGISPIIPPLPCSGPLSCSVSFTRWRQATPLEHSLPSSALDTTLGDAYKMFTLKMPPMAPPGKHVLHGPQPQRTPPSWWFPTYWPRFCKLLSRKCSSILPNLCVPPFLLRPWWTCWTIRK